MKTKTQIADLADLSPTGLIQLDADRRLLAANPAASEVFGRSLSVHLGQPLEKVIYPDAQVFSLVDHAERDRNDVAGSRIVLQGPDTATDPLDIRVAYHGQQGFVIALSPSMRRALTDTTSSMNAFAKVFGHEVKTPLAAISGAAQLLARRLADDEAGLELQKLIMSEAERLARVISRLTDFEVLSIPRLKRVNVHEVLDRVLDTMAIAVGDKASFARLYDPSLPEIEIDPDHLHQAVLNLVRNAVEAPAFDGADKIVTLSTHFMMGARLPGGHSGRGLEVRVTDNGAGMSQDMILTALRPFYSTKPGGIGIGLSVVQDVVTGHAGTLEVTSRPGETRFSMILPLRRAAAKKGKTT